MALSKSDWPAFSDPEVRAVFGAYPPELRARLLELRRLIFATAAKTGGVGRLRETLKWRQPSYLTEESGSGTTIRIDALKNEPRQVCALRPLSDEPDRDLSRALPADVRV